MPLTPMPKRRGDRGACPLRTISRACGPSPAFLIRGTLRRTVASLCRATFCVLVCPNDTIKVPRAFVEDVSDAVSYPTKWLKSSVERLSGNSESAPLRGPTSLLNGANEHLFWPLAPPKDARSDPHSDFPDSLSTHSGA